MILVRSSHVERQLLLHRVKPVCMRWAFIPKDQSSTWPSKSATTDKKDIKLTVGFPIKLANLLDMQSKESSDQINKHMLQLTRESVDGNAPVKVTTVCTPIYLPASFTAVRYRHSMLTPY